ncbi:MAG: Asp-tRNA(Asn)/Glu-tRNA(Gln) amidotransferase subunit GatA [Burkholderiales bacterium]|nr:Asp-tRNA(Asn)/Glu-tRNA(Gln) amidotransferase subunit GatA [Rhodocyclaceae bacterium]MCA3018030.1 Asp-tRNA(Asn)/Glu-tRNA(Gln) amidotransferase subunit GatA [Rhodocyclaceae bacterium]MCA3021255.1 Asp-tRNA(Asn)/Glu-tRNA(Gln) amidotransferase subunit GatA [Rhodocyclaceae bacterium]MCA3026080.1 Asp-tRNA(Asn)/Glu-tRNA(Gln) amidotransferase subunit GatA [Rhodocyclaceae bacterium]MCA3031468.1 Asp-tRNA(Asn)/Glu-tRNA(Gln) amidotransferase subunit GatA [Rhodocyclaceae bacterium]
MRTITDFSHALAAKQASAVELATDALAKATAAKGLNAFLHVDADLTLAEARAADKQFAAGVTNKPLLGVPIAHKDIFVTCGWRSTAGSMMLANYVSPFDATVVERLRAAGMVCVGKLNCDEFAMGSSNENSAFGAVQNPWDTSRIPGGSSGGSAAAISAGIVPASTGSDTGGSLRQPAAMTGITAIKPTYGRVSRYGMIAFASSLDQGGPMAHTAEDCALVLDAMAGFDERDSTSLDSEKAKVSIWRAFSGQIASKRPSNVEFAGLRIGVPKEFFAEGLSADVGARVTEAIETFKKHGATVVDISLPRTALSIPAYYVIAPAEASSNLSRFDGIRFGHRAAQYADVNDMIAKSRAEGFGREVKRRILTGAYVLSHGYYDAYYLQAQRVRRLIAQDFQTAFKSCDLIMGPVAPTTAWKIGEKSSDPVAMYLEDIFTLGVSLAGLPGMSVPCGFDHQRLPVGLQIIGNYFEESAMLAAAHRYQQLTDWHLQSPGGHK